MGTAFSEIAFTDSVKATQSIYGSREKNKNLENSENAEVGLSHYEIEFIAERDSFYQATVSESGWPYVQHRGGPTGFLKVLDNQTLGYADFRGNLQYLSVGNLGVNEKVSLILMDYPNRRRLKIWGHAHVVHEAEDSDLISQLTLPGYKVRIERGIIIKVAAYDWNCPQHITPRYSLSEIKEIMTTEAANE